MQLPLLARYKDTVLYDRARGIASVLDWRRYPAERVFAEYQTAEACALAIAEGVAYGSAAAYLAGYALALVARAWAGYPSEPRRAAIIQTGELLRRARPHDYRVGRLIDEALAHADATIVAGGDAEVTVLEFTGGAIARADRVAERCGRLAVGLLDDGDHLLTHGYAGPALAWLLALAHAEEQKQVRVTATTPPRDAQQAGLALALAGEIGVPATLHHGAAPAQAFEGVTYQVMFLGADRIALDGGVAGPSECARYAALARQHGVPCYVLGYDGPDPTCPTTATLIAEVVPNQAAKDSVVPPEQISAIITSRGIYRPEMIRRYLGDGDAPIDVIPLS